MENDTAKWPTGPEREECERAIGNRSHMMLELYSKHLGHEDPEVRFLLATLGQMLVTSDDAARMYNEAWSERP